MRTATLLLATVVWLGAGAARLAAQDHPSAVLFYPYVATHAALGIDTLIQLTNVSTAQVEARCFYEDLTPECTAGTAGESCGPGPVTCSGNCLARMARIPFRVRITAKQPLAWRLSAGLRNAPLDGVERIGPQGMSNQLTDVPGLTEPMIGTLRCVVVDAEDPAVAVSDNVIVGLATVIEEGRETSQHRAIGFRARAGGDAPDRDEFLRIGGAEAEYESCPQLLTLQQFFDGGPLRTGELTAHVQPHIVLSTCTAPLAEPGMTVAQFLVYNEFTQRFSTSRAIRGQLASRMALIDTAQPQRSIFSTAVIGTLTGQTVIRAIGSGLVAIGTDRHEYASEDGLAAGDSSRSVAFNVHGASPRVDGDVIAFRAALCPGDCDFDGSVRINELVLGVNIALEQLALDRCRAMDHDGTGMVSVSELVRATNAAIGACPESVLPATPTPAVSPTPTSISPALGPQITYFGLATTDGRPLERDTTDDEGRAVFARPYGQGMTLIIEARAPRALGRNTYSETGMPPDLQVVVANALGDGGTEVCEDDGVRGGVPGNPTLDFSAAGATEAMNDLGCRAYARQAAVTSGQAFTRPAGAEEVWAFVSRTSQIQFGIPIAKAWAFPAGDTVVAARVRDQAGNLSAVEEIVVRVTPP